MKNVSTKKNKLLSLCAILVISTLTCTVHPQKSAAKTTPVRLTYWVPIEDGVYTEGVSKNVSNDKFFKSMSDIESLKAIKKLTNIDINFINPPANNARAAFDLMINSGEEIDIIECPSYYISPIREDVLIDISDKYMKSAPNYYQLLTANSDIRKRCIGDNGKLWGFYNIHTFDSPESFYGPVIRKDFLDKYNLKPPVTVNDWENVLKVFKANGIKTPFVNDNYRFFLRLLGSAYNYDYTNVTYYVDNGVIKNCFLNNDFKLALEMLAKWYKEGFINIGSITPNPNPYNNSDPSQWADINNIGSSFVSVSEIRKMQKAAVANDSKANLIGVPYPVRQAGDKPAFIYNYGVDNTRDYTIYSSELTIAFAGITKSCKNVAEAMKYLDAMYTREGMLAMYFGTEGVTYRLNKGIPQYTDLILKNPEDLSMYDALRKYTRAYHHGPGFVPETEIYAQIYETEQQKNALELWNKEHKINRQDYIYSMNMSAEEGEEVNQFFTYFLSKEIINQVEKFITGDKSIAEYDAYVADLKKHGLESTIKALQNAYNKALKS